VFLAVALAVFLAEIAAVGFACHGFIPAEYDSASPAETETAKVAHESLLQATSHYEAARRDSSTALDEYRKSQAELLNFLSDHFGELAGEESLLKVGHVPAMSPVTPAPNKIVAAPTLAGDSKFKDLHDRLDELTKQRTKLLATLTTLHPTIQALDADITEVQQQLQEDTAEVLPEPRAQLSVNVGPSEAPTADAPALPHLVPTITESQAAALAALPTKWHDDETKARELANREKASLDKYRRAQVRERTLQNRQSDAQATLAVAMAAPTPVFNGASPVRTIYTSAIVAIIVGLAVAWHARLTIPVFRTVASVRQALHLPVVGIIPRTTSGSDKSLAEPRWIRGTVLLSELWLSAVVVLLVAIAFHDHQFFQDLLADPLAACSKKFW
jgi:hypothetical protein